jgi:hypothetical protein
MLSIHLFLLLATVENALAAHHLTTLFTDEQTHKPHSIAFLHMLLKSDSACIDKLSKYIATN